MVQQIDRAEGLVGTLGMKAPCRIATVTNITLFGDQLLDGAGPGFREGERILVRAQTNPVENGIYNLNTTGPWTRAADFDGTRDVDRGTCISIGGGTTNNNTIWQLSSPLEPIIGTSPLLFTLIAGAGFLGDGSGGGGGGGGGLTGVSPFMQTMLDDADAATARGTIQAAALHGSLEENFSVNNLFVNSAMFLPGGSVVNPQGYLGLGTNNPLSWLHVAEVNTTSNRYTSRIERVTSHTGGSGLSAALDVLNLVKAPATNREFGIYANLDNYSNSNYNVAGYFGALKRAAGNTQGLGVEVTDTSGLTDPTGLLSGFTMAIRANGTDAYGTRIAMEIVAGRQNIGGAVTTISNGLRIGAFESDTAGAYYTNGIVIRHDMQTGILVNTSGAHAIQGIWDTGTRPIGIKLSGTYSTGAIVLNAGQKVVFDPSGACVRANAAFPNIIGFENCQANFEQGWNITGGATNIAASANAGVSGAVPAQTSGYLKFRIDGVTYKLPYYNN